MNLYEKLVEIRKSVAYMKKDAKGFGYVYVDEMSILTALRPKMDELNVLLEVDMDKPDIVSESELIKSELKEHKNFIVQVGINFIFVNADDPSEKVEKKIYLQGLAGDPKVLGGLLTYATRFFLTKYFNIPTNEMDPDDWYNKNNVVSPYQLELLHNLLIDEDELKERMLKYCGVESIENISANQIKTVLKTIDLHKRKEANASS